MLTHARHLIKGKHPVASWFVCNAEFPTDFTFSEALGDAWKGIRALWRPAVFAVVVAWRAWDADTFTPEGIRHAASGIWMSLCDFSWVVMLVLAFLGILVSLLVAGKAATSVSSFIIDGAWIRESRRMADNQPPYDKVDRAAMDELHRRHHRWRAYSYLMTCPVPVDERGSVGEAVAASLPSGPALNGWGLSRTLTEPHVEWRDVNGPGEPPLIIYTAVSRFPSTDNLDDQAKKDYDEEERRFSDIVRDTVDRCLDGRERNGPASMADA